ncbi:hypothetical protein L1049_003012 [Liquidambar formosana]|uniref:FBD domain-containing protein n=1 Tax=Liquidambar formosana TaxID=63359 RepID=A0AAP0NIA8_LIQFO
MEVDFRDRFWNGFGDFICMNVDEPSFVDLESGGEELHVGCLYRLKAVDMFNISGYKCERELLKWLLQKAVVLETLYLEFERVGDESRKKLLLEYVFLLPKASSCIQVLYS